MSKVSKLADRQITELSGRTADGSYEPKKLREKQYSSDLTQAKRKQITTQLQQQYQRVSQEFKTYEEIVAGQNESFSVDPNILVEIEPYQQKELAFQQELSKASQTLEQQQQVLDRQAKRLEFLGTKVDLTPVKEFKNVLEVYGQQSSQERLAFVSNIQQEQQRDVKEFEELISTVDLSPVLATRQEQLLAVAEQKPDLVSKPYIYDKWEAKKQLQPGMTALGFNIEQLKQQKNAKIEYFEDRPDVIKNITLTDSYSSIIKRGKEKNIRTYDTYSIDFNKEGDIIKETDYNPERSMYNWTAQSKSFISYTPKIIAEVKYSGGKAVKKTEFDVYEADSISQTGWVRKTYKPFEQKVTIFNEGKLAQQKIFKPYESVRTKSPESTYITKKIILDTEKDFLGGVAIKYSTPITNIQGWVAPPVKKSKNLFIL
jgi:hypothetical protein